MSDTAFRPAKSMMAQLDELKEKIAATTLDVDKALKRLDHARDQYLLALKEERRAKRKVAFWRWTAFLTACVLIVVSAFG
jgi:hypothetical protein